MEKTIFVGLEDAPEPKPAPVRRAPDPDQVSGGWVQGARNALLDGRQVADDEGDKVARHARRQVEGAPVAARACSHMRKRFAYILSGYGVH
jgi:hypothetical protein